MPNSNDCQLYDRPCTECGECDRCDLDSTKRCDNCMKCIGLAPGKASDYRVIRIDGLLTPEESLDDEL
ncbi:hypothetical protein AGMMS49992_03180 [Clostridia bacterium]|nr:hypothetical protein AGMMS49992_03180 [Clostridia bacterium]